MQRVHFDKHIEVDIAHEDTEALIPDRATGTRLKPSSFADSDMGKMLPCAFGTALLLGLVFIVSSASHSPTMPNNYSSSVLKQVPGWPADLHKFDVGNFTSTAIGYAADSMQKVVFIAQRKKNAYKDAILAFDPESGKFITSFGGNNIGSPHGTKYDVTRKSLWVADIERHTVLRLQGSDGVVLNEFGTNGIPGTGLNPTLQFGNVADIAIDDVGNTYITDGDGGVNNRFVKLNQTFGVEWSVDHDFGSPHSIAWERGRNYIWVADRSHNRTQVFDASSGKFVMEYTCQRDIDPDSPAPISPWGIRIDEKNQELIMAANTMSGTHGHLLRLPLDSCKVLQDIKICEKCKPHELSVDEENGSVYLANIGVNSSLMKFERH